MTNLFQVLINFLEWILNPFYNLIALFCEWVWDYIQQVLNYLVATFAFLAQILINAFVWIFDRFLTASLGMVQMFSNGTSVIVSTFFPSFPSNFITNFLNYGAVGLTWMRNFIDPSLFLAPLTAYVSFLMVWTVYKIVKSWIPFIGG